MWVATANREVRSTFLNFGTFATYAATAPCNLNEVCVLAVSGGLAPTPVPWGPPGQVELDANAVILQSGANAPVTGSFTINTGPFLGVPFFFQAIRFDATSNNTSRVARVLYRN